ncbi:MAG: potassium channel protein [Elusimicrobiota bacterium]
MIHKSIIRIILVLMFIFTAGIAGYMIIEGWPFLDSLYMTVITLTTVGFMEVNTLSSAGRLFTVLLIMIGFSVIFYGLGAVTVFIVEGELMRILRRKKMKKQISKLNKHYIICGMGDTGKHVINEFISTKNPCVAIEKDESRISMLREKHEDLLYVIGDASLDDILLSAGILNAKGLITTFSSDKDNLFVVLTARSLNPGIRIVTRSLAEESEHKLRTAGANAIVSANAIGGMRMASEMLRPTVVSFLDVMLRAKDGALRVEEVEIGSTSGLAGVRIGDAKIFRNIDLIIIAVKDKEAGRYIYNPPPDTELKGEQVLIVLGKIDQVSILKDHARG